MPDYFFNSGIYPESWIPPILAAVILGIWHYRRLRAERKRSAGGRREERDDGGS
jgi:hypothetical protein